MTVNTELERIWKETVVAHPGICLDGLRKNMKNPSQDSRVSAEIRTEHIANTSLKRYGYNSLLDIYILFGALLLDSGAM
jgi:hypothetical protein